MPRRIHTITLWFFLSLLLLTGIQGLFGIVKEKELLGVVTVTQTCSPTFDSVSDGTFQRCATLHLNNRLGFRNSLIRVNSQVTFSLFGISPASNVVIGKDRYLFETGYINSWLGNDYTSREKIAGKVHRLRAFQDIMKENGVHFIVVFCPSKARFMPENLPHKFRAKGVRTNYETYVDVISKEAPDLNFIDFSAYYRKLKTSSPYTLFPRGGTHWTNFSSRYYALDSLLHYMEHLSGSEYPSLRTDRIYLTDSLLIPDDDISTLFNLIFPFPSGRITYADFGIDSAGTVKPDVLAIGDSYYWQIFGFDKIGKIFNASDFWVWNEVFYPKSRYDGVSAEDYIFLKNDILDHDFLILMVTEINLSTLLNFDEKTYALFDPENPVVKELQQKRAERIGFYRAMILNDPRWSALVREKAKIRKITFEQMVENDAEYMVDNELNQLRN